jgi:hypothetical protein
MWLSTWFKRCQCFVYGHPGVFREWEWRPTTAHWREREDAWTCIRCERDIVTPPPSIPTYIVARPYMDTRVIELVNACSDEYGVDRLRVRGGDPSTRQPRSQEK